MVVFGEEGSPLCDLGGRRRGGEKGGDGFHGKEREVISITFMCARLMTEQSQPNDACVGFIRDARPATQMTQEPSRAKLFHAIVTYLYVQKTSSDATKPKKI